MNNFISSHLFLHKWPLFQKSIEKWQTTNELRSKHQLINPRHDQEAELPGVGAATGVTTDKAGLLSDDMKCV